MKKRQHWPIETDGFRMSIADSVVQFLKEL